MELFFIALLVIAFFGWVSRKLKKRRENAYYDNIFQQIIDDQIANPPLKWPSLGLSTPSSTTHGDAQLAKPERHGDLLKPLLGGHKGIWFGAINMRDREASYVGDRHLLTVAPNRTGKGTCAIIPNLLLDKERSIICIDPKGQNAAVTAQARAKNTKVYCLNPFKEHAQSPWNLPSNVFNPLAGMNIDDPNVEADVASLAEAIIVTESSTQPYFENSARDLIELLILYALETKGSEATLLDMRGWISLPLDGPKSVPTLTNVLAEIYGKSKHEFIRELAGRFLGDSKSIGETVQSAANQTKFLSHRAIAECLSGGNFRMSDFKKEPTTLYVILPERYLDAYSRFLRVVVVSALNGLRSRPGGVKTILMLDEFARLGYLSAVEQAVGSSAGFNVQLWPFVQDLNQLQHLYPKRWDSFIANAGVVQWFTPNDSTTSEYLSKRIGKTTVLSRSLNESTSSQRSSGGSGPGLSAGTTTSSNENEVGVDFISPQELYNMPDDVQLLTLAGCKYPVLATRERYYAASQFEAFREMAAPDPYHS
jgi:type IV secretion system protein VirD4